MPIHDFLRPRTRRHHHHRHVRRGTIGGEVLHNLITGGFNGAVYAVNENADVVRLLPAYRSVEAIKAPVDLAVVVVPAEGVVDVARQCATAFSRSRTAT